MNIMRFSGDQRPERLESVDALPEEGYLWPEAKALAEQAGRTETQSPGK